MEIAMGRGGRKTKPIRPNFTAENAGTAEQRTAQYKYYFPAISALSAVNLKNKANFEPDPEPDAAYFGWDCSNRQFSNLSIPITIEKGYKTSYENSYLL